MSTSQIPEPEWVDFDDDFEEFARSARETLKRMNPPCSTQGIAPQDEGRLWQSGPPDSWGIDPFVPSGVIDEGFPQEPDSNLPAWQEMPMPPPGSMQFCDGMLVDPLPPAPRLRTIPLPQVYPFYDDGGYHYGGSGDDDNSPGGGTDYHQSAEQWTTASIQEDEVSTSLAGAKPNIIENNDRSEQSSSSTSPNSRRGYDRTVNADEKTRRLAQIREVLGIPSTEGELPTLLKIIKHLGGTVPKFEEQPGWLLKTQKQARKLGERRECFEELNRLVGPGTTKVYELKVLNNVLAKVTSQTDDPQGSQGRYEPYGVFYAR